MQIDIDILNIAKAKASQRLNRRLLHALRRHIGKKIARYDIKQESRNGRIGVRIMRAKLQMAFEHLHALIDVKKRQDAREHDGHLISGDAILQGHRNRTGIRTNLRRSDLLVDRRRHPLCLRSGRLIAQYIKFGFIR